MSSPTPNEFWATMASEADQGNLYLSPEAARKCDQVCEDFLSKLRDHKINAGTLAEVIGFGSLPSGVALAERFSKKAVDADGTNNLVDVLQSHIDVVMAMQAVFRKFFTATADTDRENASGISAQGPK